ncbi:hypothetical protein [Kitasatospora purpeofusca]|uniref:hypothetical protein n=1 Tax=Kitasatospora purpeofusca TaxID=67352 RepID=UPI0037FEBE3F
MTATPDHLVPLARRRRHARLIAALTSAVGACASATQAIYQPIADAPPGQEAVVVDPLPVLYLSHTAAPLLEAAQAEDEARWPAVVAWELKQARATFARAQEILEEPAVPGPVPLPTAERRARPSTWRAPVTRSPNCGVTIPHRPWPARGSWRPAAS